MPAPAAAAAPPAPVLATPDTAWIPDTLRRVIDRNMLTAVAAADDGNGAYRVVRLRFECGHTDPRRAREVFGGIGWPTVCPTCPDTADGPDHQHVVSLAETGVLDTAAWLDACRRDGTTRPVDDPLRRPTPDWTLSLPDGPYRTATRDATAHRGPHRTLRVTLGCGHLRLLPAAAVDPDQAAQPVTCRTCPGTPERPAVLVEETGALDQNAWHRANPTD